MSNLIFGIGYLGEGDYKSGINGEETFTYRLWYNMIKRCYDHKTQINRPTYEGCSVDLNWYCFQNFARWCEDNYYEINGETSHLDKDILIKGNKIYSPDTCVFVPQFINSLFNKNGTVRGDLPIGVTLDKRHGKYAAKCMTGEGKNKRKALGYHSTPEKAFLAYKEFKEKVIKRIASENKENIPISLYNALMNYVVEITD
jgi:hypothetical protein